MKKGIIIFIVVVMALAFVSSCQNKGKVQLKKQLHQEEKLDSVEESLIVCDDTEQAKSPKVISALKRLTQCIVDGDARQLASLVCSYPFSRQYPLRDIVNKKQMISYFDILFDDSIKNMLRRSSDNDWANGIWIG